MLGAYDRVGRRRSVMHSGTLCARRTVLAVMMLQSVSACSVVKSQQQVKASGPRVADPRVALFTQLTPDAKT